MYAFSPGGSATAASPVSSIIGDRFRRRATICNASVKRVLPHRLRALAYLTCALIIAAAAGATVGVIFSLGPIASANRVAKSFMAFPVPPGSLAQTFYSYPSALVVKFVASVSSTAAIPGTTRNLTTGEIALAGRSPFAGGGHNAGSANGCHPAPTRSAPYGRGSSLDDTPQQIRMWNTFIISMLGYGDQLLHSPPPGF